jgi:hypothetical protein
LEQAMKIKVECVCECGKIQKIVVDNEKYLAWQSGTLIQNAFPELSNNEREALKTGICPECWDCIFTDDDDVQSIEYNEYDFYDGEPDEMTE